MPEPSINSPSPLLPEQSPPIAPPVDFERMLHILDFEIERIQAEQRRPGWSTRLRHNDDSAHVTLANRRSRPD
jgi:hypothetical protein